MFEPGSVVEAGDRLPEDLWQPPAETDPGWAELPEVLPAWLLDTAGAAGFWPDTDGAGGAGQPAGRPDPAGSGVPDGSAGPDGRSEPAGAACAEAAVLAEAVVGWSIPGVSWGRPVGPVATGPSPLLVVLLRAVEAVCAVDPAAVQDAQALADAEALLSAAQQLRVHQLARSADVSARGLHNLAGFRSTAGWLLARCPDADRGEVNLAGRLRPHPV